MINGYEELYMDNYQYEGQKAKYDFNRAFKRARFLGKPETGLVHNVGGEFLVNENKATGMGPFQAYVNMVEQQVGPQNYQKLLKVYSDYTSAVSNLLRYQKDNEFYENTKRELEASDKRKAEMERDILSMSQTVSGLNNEQLDSLKDMITRLQNEKDKNVKLNESLKPVANENVKQDINNLANSCYAVLDDNVLGSEGWKKFKNPNFEQELEQDYVDTMLLPGEEKEEKRIREDAKSKYATMDIEREGLEWAVKNSEELLNHIREHGISEPLPEDIKLKSEATEAMLNMSNLVIEESAPDFTLDTPASKFYTHVANTLKETDYALNDSDKLSALYREGIEEFGIPKYPQTGVFDRIKGGFNRIIGKQEAKQANMETMYYRVLRNVDKLAGAQYKLRLSEEEISK